MTPLDGPPQHVHGQQPLPGMGPHVGERWRNKRTGAICAILDVTRRQHGWVTCRFGESTQVLRLDAFIARFERI